MSDLPPILMYHSVSDASLENAVHASMFERQMERLMESGYMGCTLKKGLESLAGMARRPIIITFDDGYADMLETVVPILSRFNFFATVFVIPDFVDSGKTPWGHRSLSWKQCEELRSAGIEIGSHTNSHPDLRGLETKVLLDEVGGSKARIEEKLGAPVRAFSYPFGYVDGPAVMAVQHAGYKAACAVRVPRKWQENQYTLQRIGITSRDDMTRFRMKISPPYRKLLNANLAGVLNIVSR